MKWTDKGHQFDEVGEAFCGKDIIIYGAGACGQELYQKLAFLDAVTAFVDKNEGLQHNGCFGKPVISILELAKIKRETHIVVIAVLGYNGQMVLNQLLHFGYRLGVNVFPMAVFLDHYLSIYTVYAKDKVYFPSISFLVTTKCNLNCRACLNFTDFNRHKRHYALSDLQRNADSFFSAVDYVEKFHMSGGEPFMYPHFAQMIRYVYERYHQQIGCIFTATNGSVLPSFELTSALKDCGVFVEVDNYRNSLSPALQKNDAVIELLARNGIGCSDRTAGYWIDLCPSNWDNSQLGDAGLMAWYNACNNPFASVHNGKLYSCNYDDYAKEADLVDDDDNDVFDLNREGGINKKELLEFRHGYTERGYTRFCLKCAGHEMINRMHVPVGEQIDR